MGGLIFFFFIADSLSGNIVKGPWKFVHYIHRRDGRREGLGQIELAYSIQCTGQQTPPEVLPTLPSGSKPEEVKGGIYS